MTYFKSRVMRFLILLFFLTAFLYKPQICYATPKKTTDKNFTLISSFSTEYSANQKERVHNLKRASSKIDGYFLDIGEEFSFNAVVGIRNKANGFLPATIIKDGKFSEGIGGGVCQVSTTLYNAVLLAGLTVTECHAHSLRVSYILPSFDAMVSYGYADLKFINDKALPLYIRIYASDTKITVKIYGESDGYQYKRVSEKVKEITPPPPDIIYSNEIEQEEILSNAKNGLISNGYLVKYKGDKIIEKTLIRKDKYLPIKGVIIKPEIIEEN